MGARELLDDLAGAGVTVTADGDRLVIRPASKLTDAMRSALKDAKPGLLAMLRANSCDDDTPNAVPGPGPDADPARFCQRRDRLVSWGWPLHLAKEVADRLGNRDRTHDDRVNCTECRHYRAGRHDRSSRCYNHRQAGLSFSEIGKDLASLLQRCPGHG